MVQFLGISGRHEGECQGPMKGEVDIHVRSASTLGPICDADACLCRFKNPSIPWDCGVGRYTFCSNAQVKRVVIHAEDASTRSDTGTILTRVYMPPPPTNWPPSTALLFAPPYPSLVERPQDPSNLISENRDSLPPILPGRSSACVQEWMRDLLAGGTTHGAWGTGTAGGDASLLKGGETSNRRHRRWRQRIAGSRDAIRDRMPAANGEEARCGRVEWKVIQERSRVLNNEYEEVSMREGEERKFGDMIPQGSREIKYIVQSKTGYSNQWTRIF
ncbi:hypothetical protein C8R43DRAFT_956923 [Mycena crocata]|nr:hypothetical protein C8R43DRAFT_956923 [Mycena crocata]